ncbi:MAG: DUF2911 domain-containing protein [Gemmatimonadota bacterium]
MHGVTSRIGGLVAVLLLAVVGACAPGTVSFACTPYAEGEELAARPSPFDSVHVAVGEANAKVCYSRPSARERVVFGGLVPWDMLWRTGANEPTLLYLDAPAQIAGIAVEPGRYSIYTVPSQSEWQVVVNASTAQWGQTRDVTLPDGNVSRNAYTSDVEAEEVGRAPIQTTAVDYVEMFTTSFGTPAAGSVDLHFEWEETRIIVPITFGGADAP